MFLSRLLSMAPVRLDWMQVGVSSRLAAEPRGQSLRSAYRERWQERDMPLEVFQQVLHDLEHVAMVHFQGWGEPLANPDIFRMAAMAVKAGCKVSTAVIEPSMLDDEAMETLAGMGVESLTVNLSSLDEERNMERAGISLQALCRSLERLERIKAAMGVERPRVMALYSLYRSSMDELARLPAFFARYGVSALLVNPLSFVPDAVLAEETVVPDSEEEYAALQDRMEAVREDAARRGMGMHYFLLHAERTPGCLENVERAFFLGPEGSVSPCIFSQFPVKGEASCWFKGMDMPIRRIVFGNVLEQPLRYIWNNPRYRDFRRQCRGEEGADECGGCWRTHIRAF